MTHSLIFHQYVSEADIDWLLCLELNSNENLRIWLAERVMPESGPFHHVQAWRSISNLKGESDLLWLMDATDGERVMVLIENKIKATAQPDQYLRYVIRGQHYVNGGQCGRFIVVLLCPEKYRSSDHKAYPHRLTYEDLITWYSGNPDERSGYLVYLLESAIQKLGNKAPIDEDISLFQAQICELGCREFPELAIPKATPVSNTQYWVYMRFQGFQIIYKMFKKSGVFGNCAVDLELAGKGQQVEELASHFASALAGTGISVERTEKSAVFRLHVPSITPPVFDEDSIRAALEAAVKLKTWWECHQDRYGEKFG